MISLCVFPGIKPMSLSYWNSLEYSNTHVYSDIYNLPFVHRDFRSDGDSSSDLNTDSLFTVSSSSGGSSRTRGVERPGSETEFTFFTISQCYITI